MELKRKLYLQGWRCLVLMGLCLSMFAAQPASARAKYYGQLFQASGRPHAGAHLYVFSKDTLATLYADADGKVPLENPVTSGTDGVYWFYADNGIYSVCKEATIPVEAEILGFDKGIYRLNGEAGKCLFVKSDGKQTAYNIVEEGIYICDPHDPNEMLSSAEAPALTLKQLDSQKGDIASTVVFERENEPGSPAKGPWRWIVNEVAPEQPPHCLILVYNTDFIRGSEPKEFQWAPRDVDDVCIRLRMTPAKDMVGMGHGGYLDYAVAPKGPAGTPPVFRNAVNVEGDPVFAGGSLLTVGEGMENTRLFRTYNDTIVPFPLAGACYAAGKPANMTPHDIGKIVVPDPDPAKLGMYQISDRRAAKNPRVVSAGSGGVGLFFPGAGKTFVKVAPGTSVKPGDTLITSEEAGCVEVDNNQMGKDRIVGWALEKSGATQAGWVLAVVK